MITGPARTGDGVPELPDRRMIDHCRRCELWECATHGVPGDGSHTARMMLVGEQPGSEEDLAGKPFVGPAGRLLRTLCVEAGLDPTKLFFTNAVKHFRWEPRGKRRLHKTPYQRHIDACHQWLAREIAAIRPSVIVALGRTALLALTGQLTKIVDARLQTLRLDDGTPIVGTYHPSAILRAIPAARHAEMRQALLMDLRRAAKLESR